MTNFRRGSKFERVRNIGMTGGYSYFLTIPREYIDELGWSKHQSVVVTIEGDHLVVKNHKPKRRAAKSK